MTANKKHDILPRNDFKKSSYVIFSSLAYDFNKI